MEDKGNADSLTNAGLALLGVLMGLWILVSFPAVVVNGFSRGEWVWSPSGALFTPLTHPMDMKTAFRIDIHSLAYWVSLTIEIVIILALAVAMLCVWANRSGSERQWNPHL